MAADIGFFLLYMCGLVSGYALLAALLAAKWRHRRLYRSARLAVTANMLLALGAAAILMTRLFARDYSIGYIFRNSSNDLPWVYTMTAFWSALEGSHFLWTILLSIFATVALWTASRDNDHIMPYVAASFAAVSSWMAYLLVTHSDPFVRMLPAQPNGQGMNALLQNPYMAIHPPTLFTGYTSLAVPAAYSVAALAYGDITEGWLKTVRRWALVAWCALTAGIALGGHWAYVELGWSGYWAWDPVENSSFIPWLLTTALLHSLLIQDKLGHLKRHSLILAFLAFFFSFFGTFITRSGIISSVHSFAESPIGPNYLTFLAGMLAVVAVLYGLRAHSVLPPPAERAWGVSKESALIVTQVLLLTFAAIVCVGTLYPIVSEAVTGARATVQAPYFNTFAPWVGLGLIVTVAVGNMMRFQSGKIPGGARTLVLSAILAVPVAFGLIHFGNVMATTKPFALGAQIVGLYLTAWAVFCLTFDLVERLRTIRWSGKILWKRNRAFVGAYVAHVGFLVGVVGFLGNFRGMDRVVTMKPGETTEFGGYEMTFKGLEVNEQENATLFEGVLDLKQGGESLGQMRPARSKYPTKAELLHEVGLFSRFWQDLYITLADFERKEHGSGTFEIHINPTVRFVWLAIVMMVIGGVVAILDKQRGEASRDAIRAEA